MAATTQVECICLASWDDALHKPCISRLAWVGKIIKKKHLINNQKLANTDELT